MTHTIPGRPEPTEFGSYYSRYIDLVPETDIIDTLTKQIAATVSFLRAIPEAKGSHRYAPEKWSIKQVIGHMADTERIFAYRALAFSRRDPAPLPGMKQDDWMKSCDFDSLPMNELIDELECVRSSTLFLFKHLPSEAWRYNGTASGNPFSVRSLAYTIVGHERHHVNVLKERYTK